VLVKAAVLWPAPQAYGFHSDAVAQLLADISMAQVVEPERQFQTIAEVGVVGADPTGREGAPFSSQQMRSLSW
jgi:hypothetical protein